MADIVSHTQRSPYSAGKLKQRYDEAFESLDTKNRELVEKPHEIASRNEKLTQSQEDLYQLNTHLESQVEERTTEVKKMRS